jgi:hypothetical protein
VGHVLLKGQRLHTARSNTAFCRLRVGTDVTVCDVIRHLN